MPALDALPASLRDEVSGRLQGAGAAGAVRFCAMTPLAISATAIRAACEHGESVRYLLPDTVLHYINEQKLYTHG
jgi:nicotinate-nucleotide adenylyltransferase